MKAKDSMVSQCWFDSLCVWDLNFRKNLTDSAFDAWAALLNKLHDFKSNNTILYGNHRVLRRPRFSDALLQLIEGAQAKILWSNGVFALLWRLWFEKILELFVVKN